VKVRVLVIEDDDAIRENVAEILAEAGYDVRTATNGLLALEQLDGGYHPDLILLDLMMPVMTGMEFRREQLARLAVARVPVLGLTAFPFVVTDFEMMSKPFGVDQLLGRAKALTKRRSIKRLNVYVLVLGAATALLAALAKLISELHAWAARR
jgi:DNA-binding response OmpR family regulator